MNPFAIGALFNGILILFIGVYVYFRNRKRSENQLFGLLSLSLAFWLLNFGFWQLSKTEVSALLFLRLLMIGTICAPLFYLHFVLILLNLISEKRRFLIFGYLITFIFLILNFTPLMVANVRPILYFPYWPVGGIAFHFWFIWTLFAVGYGMYLLLQNLQKTKGIKKEQIKYVLLAYLIILGGGVSAMPLWYGILFPPVGVFIIFLNPLILSYAIIRYRLMDIEVIIRWGAVFTLLFGIIAFLFTAGISLLGHYLPQPFSGLLAALLITVLFIPLKNFLEAATDKIFFRKQYRFEDAVWELNHILIRSPKLEQLLTNLLQHLMSVLKVKSAVAVIAESQGTFISRLIIGFDHLNISLDRTSPIIQYLESSKPSGQHRREILDCEELKNKILYSPLSEKEKTEYRAIIEELSRLGFSLALPIFSKEELIGLLLLGGKRSNDPFSNKDFKFLDVVLHEAASSVENALNMERLMRLDELKSEFITVVSHQIRTPLSVARWNFELLLEKAFGRIPLRAETVVRDTYQALMTLNQGLNNLMTVLEIEEGKAIMKYENVEINQDIIEEAISNLSQEILSKKITIKRRFSFKKNLNIDRQKIKRIFEILLDNAVRYSPVGSTVVISTLWQKKGEKNEILVSIDDEGISIPPENYEFIFKKFFRGEEAKKMSPAGFGLGLFTAREYIKLHGGQLWLGKKKRPGSIFHFTIPVDKTEPKSDTKI